MSSSCLIDHTRAAVLAAHRFKMHYCDIHERKMRDALFSALDTLDVFLGCKTSDNLVVVVAQQYQFHFGGPHELKMQNALFRALDMDDASARS